MPECFHCGLPVLEPGRWRTPLAGAERDFCCVGCEAVASTIAGAGLGAYYARRSSPARTRRPDALLSSALVYDDLQAQFAVELADGTREATLILEGIRCTACLWLNEQILRELPGLKRADINYSTRRAVVVWDPSVLRLSQVIEAIRSIGYDAAPYSARREDEAARREQRAALWRLFVAGFGAMQVMMYAFPAYMDEGASLTPEAENLMRWASLLITLPVVIFSCGPFFSGAWRSVRRGSVGMDLPIALGVALGFGASAWATLAGGGEVYFDSISMLAFLLLSARWVEMAARNKAAAQLDHLLRWMPSFALRLDDAQRPADAQRIEASRLVAGDIVLVPPGERVPADGVVIDGSSACDESLLTGESQAVRKAAGARLVGGSLNLEQALVMRVLAAGAATQAAAISRLVERAAAMKPRLVESADRVARMLTAVVLVAAALSLAWWSQDPARALWVAIAVLVATCPCALALAAPIVLTRASASLLAHGAALTRSAMIEPLARATDIVFDKTGTLTLGQLTLETMRLRGARSEARCLALARALEAGNRHPAAAAFARASADEIQVTGLGNHPGQGVEAVADGIRTRIGTRAFCAALGHAEPETADHDREQRSAVHLADETGWLATFLLSDRLRPEAKALVESMQRRGLRVHLLSGDAPAVVDAIARRLGIEAAVGAATPEAKLAYLRALQGEGRVVVMVGDGLNDAPVLAGADASIAMGGGSAAAQQQADLVLLGDRSEAIDAAFGVSRRAMALIRGNFAWAAAYNAVVLPLAVLGYVGPWEAAIGMAASSFIVMLNALRPLQAPDRTPTAQLRAVEA